MGSAKVGCIQEEIIIGERIGDARNIDSTDDCISVV